MIGQSLVDAFGKDLKKSFGSMPGSTGKGSGVFAGVAKAAGIDSSGPYTGESYDAAALIVLAMQAGGSADRASIAKNVMDVACLLYTSPSPRDTVTSRMPSSA